MRPDIVPGATLPDYQLPDHTRTPRKLSEFQGAYNTMILMLGRGAHCAKDRQQLAQLVEFSAQCGVGYTRIVTITCDQWVASHGLRLGVGAHWPFLHDPGHVVRDDLDIAEYTASGDPPMIAHTLVLAPGLRIHRIYNGYWYWGRPSVADLHRDLRELTNQVRFDADLGAPEVKGAWERGERRRFYPYERSFQDTLAEMGVSAGPGGDHRGWEGSSR
jgi:peroxiredoxin